MATLRLGAAKDYLILEENPLRGSGIPERSPFSLQSQVHSSFEVVGLGWGMFLISLVGRFQSDPILLLSFCISSPFVCDSCIPMPNSLVS
jgi:hypothetical protein